MKAFLGREKKQSQSMRRKGRKARNRKAASGKSTVSDLLGIVA